MFNKISWSSYLLITSAITAIYYFLIAVIYYRNEITKIIFSRDPEFINIPAKERRENTIANSDFGEEAIQSQAIQNENEDAYQSSMVHELMDELNKVFEKASEKKFLKEELILALQLALENYLQLKDGPFQNAINSLIELESQSKCSIYLNEDEMEMLWKAR